MSEKQNPETGIAEGTEKPSRPRREDGTFMSKTEIEKLQKKSKDADSFIIENNKVLMQGTGLSKDHFKGMNPREINKFLVNFHKKKAEEPEPEPENESNTPILGTPVGSGKKHLRLDDYLKIKVKDGRPDIDFDAPASLVFGKHKNKEEAKNKWLEAR